MNATRITTVEDYRDVLSLMKYILNETSADDVKYLCAVVDGYLYCENSVTGVPCIMYGHVPTIFSPDEAHIFRSIYPNVRYVDARESYTTLIGHLVNIVNNYESLNN